MFRRLLLVAAVGGAAACAAGAAAPDAPARRDGHLRLAGTATFPVVDGAAKCTFDRLDGMVRERCVPDFGTFAGTLGGAPARAGASLGFTWLIDVRDGAPTGTGTERLTLKLNFGGGRLVTLACKGRIKPVGTRTAQGETTAGSGSCTVRSAKGLARTLEAALRGGCKKASGRRQCTYKTRFERRGNRYTKARVTVGIVD